MLTNMLKEYFECQESLEKKYKKDCIVLMMVGSFYECYGLECKRMQAGNINQVSKILGMAKTLKNKSKKHDTGNPYMCGFPSFSLSKHVHKLINSNITVAIYNQHDIENKKTKCRKLEHIISPSTYIEDDYHNNNILMCILHETFRCPIHHLDLSSAYISYIDLSTGKNYICSYYDSKENNQFVREEIDKLIDTVQPSEILTNMKIKKNILLHDLYNEPQFKNKDYILSFLEKIFGKQDIINVVDYLNINTEPEYLHAYIQLLQFAYEHNPHIVEKIKHPQNLQNSSYLKYNHDAFTQLNILNKNNTNLFKIINYTITKMGERLLQYRISHPLIDSNLIQKRYDYIDTLVQENKLDGLHTHLVEIHDVEKKLRKMILHQLKCFQFADLDHSFQHMLHILQKYKHLFCINTQIIKNFKQFIDYYQNIFNIELMKSCQDYTISFFNNNQYPDIDLLQHKITHIEKMLIKIKGLFENERAGVHLINIDKEGYTIKLTKKAWDSIKDEDRKMTLDDTITCHIQDFYILKQQSNYIKLKSKVLIQLENTLTNYSEKLQILIKQSYEDVCQTILQDYYSTCCEVCDIIAEIDVSYSGAILATQHHYCKPIIKKKASSYVIAKSIRHPIIEVIHDDEMYVPNDVSIGCDEKCILLFGINSSGKSSLLRSIGCNIMLAQMGMYTSCDSFEYSPYTKLLTKISCQDNLFKAQSTFISEMLELKHILHHSDQHSMVMCDELTSGTEINSSIGLVCSTLLTLLKKKCNILFTTHLHHITNYIQDMKSIRVCHFDVNCDDETQWFDRKLKEGPGKSEYGIEIASKLNLDAQFIKCAYEYRNKYKGETKYLLNTKKSRYNSKVYIDCCQLCGNKNNLQTHHIQEQHLADESGMIQHFHKNTKFNLCVVCETCHQKIHHH